MASPEQMLRELHTTMNIHGGLMPVHPTADIPADVRESRLKLLKEEYEELRDAIIAGDLVGIADGAADLVTCAVGTTVVYGIPFDAALAAVHASNMTKTNDPARPKLVKGPGYQPPRIAELLAVQGRERVTGGCGHWVVPDGKGGWRHWAAFDGEHCRKPSGPRERAAVS
jgi:hypothetical protein